MIEDDEKFILFCIESMLEKDEKASVESRNGTFGIKLIKDNEYVTAFTSVFNDVDAKTKKYLKVLRERYKQEVKNP